MPEGLSLPKHLGFVIQTRGYMTHTCPFRKCTLALIGPWHGHSAPLTHRLDFSQSALVPLRLGAPVDVAPPPPGADERQIWE